MTHEATRQTISTLPHKVDRPQISIVALAGDVGRTVLTREELGAQFGLSPDKITAKTGVTTLRRLGPGQTLVGMAREVAHRVLEMADVRKEDLRGVFGSSNPTADDLLPTFTASAAHAIGLSNVIVDHIGTGCCGGLQAMRNAYNQLVVDHLDGRVSHCLVIAGDHTSRILNPARKQTGTLFGEGVAAVVMSNSRSVDSGYVVRAIGTKSLLGDAMHALRLRSPYCGEEGAPRLEMDGRRIFEFGAGIFEHFLELVGVEALPRHCYVVPHQPNLRMLEAMIEREGLDPRRVYTEGIRTIGNTSSAAALLGLEDAIRRGALQPSEPVLLGAFGAELQVGAALLEPLA